MIVVFKRPQKKTSLRTRHLNIAIKALKIGTQGPSEVLLEGIEIILQFVQSITVRHHFVENYIKNFLSTHLLLESICL